MAKQTFRQKPKDEVDHGRSMSLELPLRPRADMKTPCYFCHDNINYPDHKSFIAVITEADHGNLFFHRNCYPASTYDPMIYENNDPECAECGHPYHRHYDLFEDDQPPVGCKYCQCMVWVPKDEWSYPKEEKEK